MKFRGITQAPFHTLFSCFFLAYERVFVSVVSPLSC
jgi:hypothetical protein